MGNELLQSAFPIGTPKELEDCGINPKTNCSCANPDNASGFKGCSYYEECVFARDHGKVLAFRDQGPKNVGHSIHLAEWGPEVPPNEDWGPCYRFMATLSRRMAYGNYLRENEPKKARDDVKIIANEGEVVWLHRQVSTQTPGSKTIGTLKTEDEAFRIPIHDRPAKLVEPKGKAAEIAAMREAERNPKSEGKKSAVPA